MRFDAYPDFGRRDESFSIKDGACEGSGANVRIWPAMMSAELPEGWA